MSRIDIPRLLVTGIGGGVGKTTLCLALLHELKRRGIQVAAAVTGPHLHVASLYERITGRAVACLDPTLLSRQQLLAGVERAAIGAELLVIDGQRGLFDGSAGASAGSDAEVAALTHTPVLFVVDVRQWGPTLAAAIKGVQAAQRGIEWIGVALNRLAQNFEGRGELVSALEQYKAAPALVSLPELDPLPPVLPNLVSQLKNTTLLDRSFLNAAGQALSIGSDIEQLLARCSVAPALDYNSEPQSVFSSVKIGVARDSCFALMFQDNLEILRRLGAQIHEFSPLADTQLPSDLDGLYFPGGYVAEYGPELALNEGLRSSIATFMENGGGLYAEGASLGFLSNRFRCATLPGELPGAGVLNGVAAPVRNAVSASKAEAALLEYGLLGDSGDLIKGLYGNDWKFEHQPGVARILRIVPNGGRALLEGYSPGPKVFCTFGFWHFGSCPSAAPRLVQTWSRRR